jgi:pyruvate,water dikinase
LALLQGDGDAGATLARLRSWPGGVGPAASAYLDLVGLRVIGGYDIADEHAREHPDLLVKILRAAVAQDDPARRASAERAVADLRGRVPADRREEFDEMLRDAQAGYGCRDERIFYGDALGAGAARRAVLEAGARLHAAGRLMDPSHAVDATLDELVTLLESGTGPSAAELAERVRFRLETSIDAAPARLGFAPSPPPPADWLPPPAARLQRAVDMVLGLMFAAREQQRSQTTLQGFSASPGTYEGRARVINDIGELPSVVKGEVLVTRSTGPTFNVVLPLIGAIVTERGGALSHAAIVAREYGLPAVVGCGGATRAITTGARVRVDGGTGEVCILG